LRKRWAIISLLCLSLALLGAEKVWAAGSRVYPRETLRKLILHSSLNKGEDGKPRFHPDTIEPFTSLARKKRRNMVSTILTL